MGESTEAGSLKGSALRSFLLWYEGEYGAGHHAEDVAGLPAHLQPLVDPSREALGVLASKWYPAELGHALFDQMLARTSAQELDAMVRRAGPAVLRMQMTGLQRRAFNLLMNPNRYRRYVQTIWNQNFDSGEIEVLETGPQEHHGFTRNWRGHHVLICRLVQTGKQAIYEAMGCKNVTVELTGCVSEGAEACSSKVRWSA
jgi:hypothetical protein